MRYTFRVPTINGEPIVKIKKRKKEKISDYQIYPDRIEFTTNYFHVELKDYLIRKESD